MSPALPADATLPVSSELFQSYRTVGVICDSVRPHYKQLGKETFVTVCTGQQWQVYRIDGLYMTINSAQNKAQQARNARIQCITSHKQYTFTAVHHTIYIYKRNILYSQLSVDPLYGHITHLYLFGNYLLCFTSCGEQTVLIYNCTVLVQPSAADEMQNAATTVTDEIHAEHDETDMSASDYILRAQQHIASVPAPTLLQLNHGQRRHVTGICHPTTYLNKLLFTYNTGELELWNVNTQQCIYRFKHHIVTPHTAITCIAMSNVLDIVGIGYENGDIVLHNILNDTVVMTFQQQSRVTCMSFRTDDINYMVTGTVAGHMNVWSLDKQLLHHIHVYAHTDTMTSAYFVPNQPLLVTTSSDNSIKQWIFDSTTHNNGQCRLYRQRSGHSAPPTKVKFISDSENTRLNTILTCGLDRSLRSYCMERDQQAFEYSQGHMESTAASLQDIPERFKLTPCIDFATILTTKRQATHKTSNIVSCHINDTAARIWSTQTRAMDKRKLIHTSLPLSACTAVAVDVTGNYALVGHADGRIDKFNLQSTLYKHSYGCTSTGVYTADRHQDEVRGMVVDALNQTLLTVSLDGMVKWWKYNTTACIHTMELSGGITHMTYNHTNDLLAVACEDLNVYIIDTNAHTVVRSFLTTNTQYGHTHTMNDIAFSSDGYWLVTASNDSTLRIFDISSGQLIDWLAFNKPVTSVVFSSNNTYMCTTHTGYLGVCTWVNKTLFDTVQYRAHITQPISMDYTEQTIVDTHSMLHADNDDSVSMLHDSVLFNRLKQSLHSADSDPYTLISYSNVPRTRWTQLLQLDTIKERNRPVEPPKQPQAAPFFLTALTGMQDENGGSRVENENAHTSRVKKGKVSHTSVRIIQLIEQSDNHEYADAVQYLLSLSSAQLDGEIRLIGVDFDSDIEQHELTLVLRLLLHALHSRHNFELMQSVLALVLSVHTDAILKYSACIQLVQQIQQVQSTLWGQLKDTFHNNLTLVAHISGLYIV